MTSVDLNIVLPEIILAIFAMAGLLLGVYGGKDKMTTLLSWASVVLMVVLAAVIGLNGAGTREAFGGMFVDDGFSRFAKVTVLLAGAAVIDMSIPYVEKRDLNRF